MAIRNKRLGIPDPSAPRMGAGDLEAPLSFPLDQGQIFPADDRSLAAGLKVIDPDADLTKAFLGGSDDAFIRLYAKYEISLFYYCKRMLHNEWAAEDAFQEIWTRIFELRKRSNDKAAYEIGHFRGLLFKSARNLCMNMLRMERHTESVSEDREEEDREPLMTLEPMSGEASQREIQALMIKGLQRLPFDQRETFVLREYSGFSYAEIAEIMQVPEQNVRVRSYRARLRLRKFIQGWLGLDESDDPVSYI
jgi:RNA polymerase sigma-70 factor (ECF subfamily)